MEGASTMIGQTEKVEMYICECGSTVFRNDSGPALPCLACEAYDTLRSGNWMDASSLRDLIFTAGRVHGPHLLAEAFADHVIEDEDVSALVGPVWCGSEFPDLALPWDEWRAMFDVAGYTCDGISAERPVNPLVLYRAASDEHRAGHSWTDDLDIARSFLRIRSTHHPRLWSATVEPARLLAALVDYRPGESQFVVETAGLEISEHTEA